MLATIRGWARSLPFKVLMILLVVSFAVWGVGDILGGRGTGSAVAEIGDQRVELGELEQTFRRALQRFQLQTQQPLSREDAIGFGMLEQSLQTLMAQRLLDAEAANLGVIVADETVARLVAQEASFQRNGAFDRELFDAVLRQNGYTEEEFLDNLRGDRRRGSLTSAMRSLAGYPAPLRDALVDYLATTRSGRLLVVGRSDVADDVPEPTDGELETYLEENAGAFRVPERRTINAVLLSPDQLTGEIAIDPAAVEAAYNARIDQYSRPEQRFVRQLRSDEEEPLREAYQAILAGETIDEVAARFDEVGISALGLVTRDNLPEAFAEAIFAVEKGSETPPVGTALGWNLFRVDDIKPATVTPLEEVSGSIEAQLKRERAAAELPDVATALDDEIGAGLSLREAAANLQLTLEEGLLIDRSTRDANGDPVPVLQAWPDLTTEAFTLTPGEISLLQETDDGRYFVVEVAEISEARTQTLDEARDGLTERWREDQAGELARQRAADLMGQLATDDLEAFAAEHDLDLLVVNPTTRDGTAPTAGVVAALFDTPLGALAAEPVDTAAGAAILIVDDTTGVDEATVEGVGLQVDNGYALTLLAEFESRLRSEHPITVNRGLIDQAFMTEPES